MKKTEIQINLNDFPSELHYIFENATVYDSSSHPTMTVYYSDHGYYVKIGAKGSLATESEMVKLFDRNRMGVELVTYISHEKDYMVTKPAEGEDATHHLDNPEKLCEVLAEAMKFLHSRPVEGIPVSPCMDTYAKAGKAELMKQDTFIHGDFCLPNIMLDNWKFSTFIDVGLAGVGDKHIDIYWVLWSLNYNLGTDKYTDYFLDLYGRDKVDMDILKMVAEAERMSDISYRKATIEDCFPIAELKGIVWNTTYRGIYPDESLDGYDVGKNALIIQKIVNNPEIEIYVAEDKGKIVGFMTCGKPYKPFRHYEQEIGLLYILKEYQRQGIGRGFFDVARKQVKENGYKEFIVSVNSQNSNAIQFYRSMGGEAIDTTERQLTFVYVV